MSSSSVPNENLGSINPSAPQTTLSTESLKKWELGVSLVLHNWSVLTDAVVAQWGGPDSDDKRDWLCGAIADMFTEREETDEYDIESVLVQVMGDEFQVNLEDDSAWGVKIYNISHIFTATDSSIDRPKISFSAQRGTGGELVYNRRITHQIPRETKESTPGSPTSNRGYRRSRLKRRRGR
jgi:hypothetical protein